MWRREVTLWWKPISEPRWKENKIEKIIIRNYTSDILSNPSCCTSQNIQSSLLIWFKSRKKWMCYVTKLCMSITTVVMRFNTRKKLDWNTLTTKMYILQMNIGLFAEKPALLCLTISKFLKAGKCFRKLTAQEFSRRGLTIWIYQF